MYEHRRRLVEHQNGVTGTVEEPLDPKVDNPYVNMVIPEEGFILQPGELYLAQTHEYTETRNLVPVISGRSSTGRLGLHVHITAGYGDIGFKGHWTLELAVIRPLRIYPLLPIAQIYYNTVVGYVAEYRGKYQGNQGVQPSKMWQDFLSPSEVERMKSENWR